MAASLAITQPARGSIIVTTGNLNGFQIKFDEPGLLSSGPLVQGLVDGSNHVVDFSSTSDNLVAAASGTARIESSDGGFTDLSIQLAQGIGSFGDLGFNLHASVDGAAVFTITTLASGSVIYNATLDGNGQNRFWIHATDGDSIKLVNITSSVDLQNIRQPDIATVNNPEPGTVLLFGGGLALIAFRRLRGRASSHKRP